MTKTNLLEKDLGNALLRLKEALQEKPIDLNKDATIQRFEFTFELAWKLMQSILKENGIETYGIKTVIREAARFGMVDDPKAWFKFLEDRNLTSHTYKEDEARSIYERIKDFPLLVVDLIEKVKLSI